MSSIAILTRPGERIQDGLVIPGSLSDTSQLICGPEIHGAACSFGRVNLIHQPSGPQISNPMFRSQMQPLIQAGPVVERAVVEAMEEFGSDTMLGLANIAEAIQVGAETGFRTVFESSNGHIGGAAGAIKSSVNGLLTKLVDVNEHLHRYANTHNHSKHAVKASLRSSYAAAQSEFNYISNHIVNYYRGGRESALLSMKRGIEVAEKYKSRALPLNTLPEISRLTKVLAGARYVAGVGLILDLGFRFKKIENAFWGPSGSTDNGIKTASQEALGFSLAFVGSTSAFMGSSMFFCTFMGPFGIVPAIVVSGTVGMGLDQAGRSAGTVLYNFLKDY